VTDKYFKYNIGDLVYFRMDNAYFGLCIIKGFGKNYFKDGQYQVVDCITGEVYIAFEYELFPPEEFPL